jgi:signal transduction histidine kinase
MRALIFELRPESLAVEGLIAALDHQLDAIRARHGLTVEASLGREPDVPLAVKEALYRIAQEALHNTVKHARATTVMVSLENGPEELALDIGDDGSGFDPDEPFPGHLGLQTMRERAVALGGSVQVESGAGGTRVHARLPITRAAAAVAIGDGPEGAS